MFKISISDAVRIGFTEVNYGIYSYAGNTYGSYNMDGTICIGLDQHIPDEIYDALCKADEDLKAKEDDTGSSEYWRSVDESAKEHRLSQKKHLLKFVKQYDHEIINADNHHYRLDIGDKKLDVWLSTTKHSLVGSNKFGRGLNVLKKLIKKIEGEQNGNV